jgi:hypothetical protein
MTSVVLPQTPRLSSLRLVSFVPAERDAVHVGLLTPDAEQVVDLTYLGIADALEALEQLLMLRQAAGAILHGAARTAHPVSRVHLVAAIPLVRSVVRDGDGSLHFADPATLQGPGGHLGRREAARSRVGLAAVVGETIAATSLCPDEVLDRALIGTLIVLGWPQQTHELEAVLRPGAIGPFVAVPRRKPESVVLTRVAPIGTEDAHDAQQIIAAPTEAEFFALARAALRSHTLRPGDLLTIFPGEAATEDPAPMIAGSGVRVSAPGLGTLSLAVR